MVDVNDIKDQESLLAWFNARPNETAQQDAVDIAHRAAMQVGPVNWNWTAQRAGIDDLTALPVLRACLISGVAAAASTTEIKATARAAARAAAFAARIAARAADVTADAAARAAARAAASADAGARATAFAAHSANAAANAGIDPGAIWESVREDCRRIEAGTELAATPLWHGLDTPLGREWQGVKSDWQARGEGWQFWIDWYDAARAGTPLNLKMLIEIATQHDDFWQGTDDEVNARIAEIAEPYSNVRPVNVPPDRALVINRQALLLQLSTLLEFLSQQILEMRGRNELPQDIADKFETRTALMLSISADVERMRDACEDENAPGTALRVIEETLPEVVGRADELSEQGGAPQTSEAIITMAATIKVLTDSGTPGHVASGVAALELMSSTIRKWFARD